MLACHNCISLTEADRDLADLFIHALTVYVMAKLPGLPKGVGGGAEGEK